MTDALARAQSRPASAPAQATSRRRARPPLLAGDSGRVAGGAHDRRGPLLCPRRSNSTSTAARIQQRKQLGAALGEPADAVEGERCARTDQHVRQSYDGNAVKGFNAAGASVSHLPRAVAAKRAPLVDRASVSVEGTGLRARRPGRRRPARAARARGRTRCRRTSPSHSTTAGCRRCGGCSRGSTRRCRRRRGEGAMRTTRCAFLA